MRTKLRIGLSLYASAALTLCAIDAFTGISRAATSAVAAGAASSRLVMPILRKRSVASEPGRTDPLEPGAGCVLPYSTQPE